MTTRTPRQGRRFGDTRLLDARIAEATLVTPTLREIRLRGPALGQVTAEPGAHLRVELPTVADTWRTYSVWRSDPRSASLTLRVVLHDSDAPGSHWAATAEVGGRLRVGTPRNRIRLDPRARYHLFVGEETGAVPLLTMLAATPPDAAVHGVLEAADAAAEFDPPTGVRLLPWAHRGGASAASSPVLVRAVRALELPRRPGTAYVAGEARTCRAIVTHLVRERAWPRRAIQVQPHWTPGRTGLE